MAINVRITLGDSGQRFNAYIGAGNKNSASGLNSVSFIFGTDAPGTTKTIKAEPGEYIAVWSNTDYYYPVLYGSGIVEKFDTESGSGDYDSLVIYKVTSTTDISLTVDRQF